MQGGASEQVTPAHHEADLNPNPDKLADFHGHAIKDLRVDAEVLIPHKRLAAQLEQNTAVLQRSGWLRHDPAPVLRQG